MNTERIRHIADVLDQEPKYFSMNCYYHLCGTAACIAGHVCKTYEHKIEEEVFYDFPSLRRRKFDTQYYRSLRGRLNPTRIVRVDSLFSAAVFLDLDHEQATQLFLPQNEYVAYDVSRNSEMYIEPRHAAAVLRHLAETGKIDWSIQPLDLETMPVIEELIQAQAQAEEPVPA